MCKNYLNRLLYSTGIFTSLFSCKFVLAQVIPDNTLSVEEISTVAPANPNNISSELIQGGAIRNSTLFHSFQEFSIPEGSGVYFENPSGIENILSRVTGSQPSSILGTIGVLGNANLFFINPNGIIFGSNARLDIRGSFLASTASSIKLPDNFEFAARDPQPVPLLQVSVPIGLGLGVNPASLKVEGTGHNLIANELSQPVLGTEQNLSGLKTPVGKTIGLIGGNVNLDGGILSAPSGRIEVGSIADGVAAINLVPAGIILTYDGVTKFQNIELSNRALLDASGFFNGNIFLQGEKISLTSGSLILNSNFGDSNTGKININATQAVKLNGIINFNSTQQNLAVRIQVRDLTKGVFLVMWLHEPCRTAAIT